MIILQWCYLMGTPTAEMYVEYVAVMTVTGSVGDSTAKWRDGDLPSNEANFPV